MTNQPVIEGLKKSLADSYVLYLKTQNYHWNVEGPNFHSLHTMFEEQYTDLAAAIDEIAERIRTLGEKAPGTLEAFDKDRSIKPGDENASAKEMVKELADDQKTIVKTLYSALNAANEAEDEATVDLMTQRIAVHEKNGWMLRSVSKAA